MKSHELFRKLLQNRNAKELAGALNLSTSSIYKWTESSDEGGSGALNPLDRIEQLIKATGDKGDKSIAQWVCEQAGGFYVKNPDASHRKEARSVIVASNKIVQEFADMISLIATAAIDNSITDQEAVNIRERWEDLKSASEEFVNCCEQGDFKPIHAHAERGERNPKEFGMV